MLGSSCFGIMPEPPLHFDQIYYRLWLSFVRTVSLTFSLLQCLTA